MLSQRSGATNGSKTVVMPSFCAAAKTSSGVGTAIEASKGFSVPEASDAWPVGEEIPCRAKAAPSSSARVTKPKASTFVNPMALSLASVPSRSAVSSSLTVQSWMEIAGLVIVVSAFCEARQGIASWERYHKKPPRGGFIL